MVDILLATFNGEKFLAEQLNSLINQSYKDWRVLIHDDGSSDKTIEIVKEFQKIDIRIILIEDQKTFGNAGNNFMHLLKMSTSEFIIFCDQDDIWNENKINEHLLILKNAKAPAMVYSNGYTFDTNGVNETKFITFHRNNLQDSLFLNGGIHGCCTMINRLLLEKVNFEYPDYIYMHDHFITILAVTFGKTYYIDKPLMLYRQHENNVTGNIKTSKIDILRTFLDPNNPVLEKRHYNANVSFFEKYQDFMKPKSRSLFIDYIKYPNVNVFQRLKIVLGNSFKVKNIQNLLLKTMIRKPL